MKTIHTLCALFALLIAPPLFAHSHLAASDPADGATLAHAPEQVSLKYSEPLELRYSTFSLHRLGNDQAAEPTAENAVKTVPVRARDGGSAVVLPVPTTLEPGWYGVDWEVLSIDGHTSQGVLRFRIGE